MLQFLSYWNKSQLIKSSKEKLQSLNAEVVKLESEKHEIGTSGFHSDRKYW